MGSKIAARALMTQAGVPGRARDRRRRSDRRRDRRGGATRSAFPSWSRPRPAAAARECATAATVAELRPRRFRRPARGGMPRSATARSYVERLIERPRHVEVQIFGDAHGNVVHLFERECSIQRRHQKVIEESPVAGAHRRRCARGWATRPSRAARAVGYRNAGTIEFLLEGDGDAARFYFLEMNTRLQVEHPVTEAGHRHRSRSRAARRRRRARRCRGGRRSSAQRGHAIECRVYAEDPVERISAAGGPLRLYREPTGPGVRVDSGVEEGADVPVQYDPLLAKLIASARTGTRRSRGRRSTSTVSRARRPDEHRLADSNAVARGLSGGSCKHAVRRRARRVACWKRGPPRAGCAGSAALASREQFNTRQIQRRGADPGRR